MFYRFLTFMLMALCVQGNSLRSAPKMEEQGLNVMVLDLLKVRVAPNTVDVFVLPGSNLQVTLRGFRLIGNTLGSVVNIVNSLLGGLGLAIDTSGLLGINSNGVLQLDISALRNQIASLSLNFAANTANTQVKIYGSTLSSSLGVLLYSGPLGTLTTIAPPPSSGGGLLGGVLGLVGGLVNGVVRLVGGVLQVLLGTPIGISAFINYPFLNIVGVNGAVSLASIQATVNANI